MNLQSVTSRQYPLQDVPGVMLPRFSAVNGLCRIPGISSTASFRYFPLPPAGVLPAVFSGGAPFLSHNQPFSIMTANMANYSIFGKPFEQLQEEPKPSQSYIGLIAMAILNSANKKLVLSDIYQWIQDHYTYFRVRGPGWKNSIRHNLSLNDCFIKTGRSANGKGHYWSIHPANMTDFIKGDFRRRKAQQRVKKHLTQITTLLDESDMSENDADQNLELHEDKVLCSIQSPLPQQQEGSVQLTPAKPLKRAFDIDSLLSIEPDAAHITKRRTLDSSLPNTTVSPSSSADI